jgi:hypothetical protein
MKKDVPVITERILEFMNDPRNRDAIRTYIIEKLDEYADETFSEIDYTLHDQIIATHGYETRSATITALQGDIQDTQQKQRPFVIALFILIGICGIMLLTSKQLSQAEVIGYIALCFILLLAGLLLPMIEIDARISDLKFSFLGESISFTDQVLYYKSKSILEVVHLMVTQSRVDLLLVGMLVLAFSVLFPVAKLICSVIFVFDKRMQEHRLIRFIVFKTGKWSMADVMVVAIFMAYIGFSGIIGEQHAQLQRITDNLEILTTNQSCLLIGFYLFTSFAVLSLLVSHKMQYGRG